MAHYPLNGTLKEKDGEHADITGDPGYTTDMHGKPNSALDFNIYGDIFEVPCSSITGLLDFTISIWAYGSNWNNRRSTLISIAN